MRRKLIPQGSGGSLTVYLPKKWVDLHGLKSGDEVEVKEDGPNIFFSVIGSQPRKVKNIILRTGDGRRLRTLIATAYRCGFEVIKITGVLPDIIDVQRIIDSLPGFMIVSDTEKEIMIENLIEERIEPTDKVVRRFFHRCFYLMDSIINNKKNIDELYRATLQLRDYAQRSIFMNSFGNESRYEWYELVFLAEKVSGLFYEAYRLKIESPLFSEARTFFIDLTHILFGNDIKKSEEMVLKLSKRKKEIYSSAETPITGAIFEHLFSVASRIMGLLS